MLDSTMPASDLAELAYQRLRDKWDQEARDCIARTPIYTEEPLPPHHSEYPL